MAEKPTYEELEQRVIHLEKKLKNSTTELGELKKFIDRSSDMLYRYDLRSRTYVLYNKTGYEFHGIPYGQLPTLKEVLLSIHPEDRDRVRKASKDSLDSGRHGGEVEFRQTHADGSTRWMRDRWTVIRDNSGEPATIEGITRDETERKLAEEALQQSEEKYRLLFNSTNDAVFVHQPTAEGKPGRFIEANDVTCQRYGYTREEILGLTPLDLAIHERERDARERVRRLLSEEHSVFETIHKTKDGNEIPVEISAHLFDFRGQRTILSIVRDITDRKQAEEALRLSEERYRSFIENAPIGMYTVNIKGEFTYGNRKLLEITGYKGEDWLNKPFHPIVHPDDLSIVLDKFQQRIAGLGTAEPYEIRVFHASGKTIWMKITSESIYETDQRGEKRLVGIQSFTEDITDRKRAEGALRKERDRAQIYLDITGVMFVALDANGEVRLINRKGCEILGYDEGEIIGKNWFDYFLPQEIKDEVKDVFQQLMQGKIEPVEYFENPIVRKSGQERMLAWHNALLKNEKGEIIGTFSSGEDITDRKRAEEERKKLEAQLQQAQKMESIGTLAGGIAHDFNNILSPIIINTELALMDIPEGSTLILNLNEVLKASKRAKDLVMQILTFSRQTEQERVPLNLSSIVKEATKLLRSSLPATIEIRQNILTKSDTILADPTQIHQVLMNLCTNAYHAMREKGGVLEVSLSDVYLDEDSAKNIGTLKPGPYLRLSVNDTGYGIDPDFIDKIFEPYLTTKEKGVGTGLGLAVVLGIVKDHGGSIQVESVRGGGTTFNVFFPKIDLTSIGKADTRESMPTGNERILLVDDEAAIINAGKQMLERLGYKVVTRTGSIDALEFFRSQPDQFDLILTDMTMPNMTGVELSKEIMNIRSDIPVILCTGFSEKIDEKKALELGIKAFVMKPIVMGKMANTIRRVLDEK